MALKRTEFIRDGEGKFYLPRPDSWLGGMARHLWFQHYVGKATIASPKVWRELSQKHGVFLLTEGEDGKVLTESIKRGGN